MNRLISIWIVLLFFCRGNGWAQPAYKATLPVINTTGYYKIDLPYSILGAARPDLADIRIKDEKGKETAWLLRKDEVRNYTNEFIPYRTEISSGKYQTDVTVETEGKPVSSFVMRIKNADTCKKASLLGSHDKKTWFTVSEHIQLTGINNPNDTEAFIKLKFPLSDYSYYKISIKDSLSSPINITGIGILQNESSLKQVLINIPLKTKETRKNGKYTDIKLIFPFKIRVSKLEFYISSPSYYKRNLKLYPPYTSETLIADGGKPLTMACNLYTDTLLLSVNNGDDRPLTIDSIKAFTPKYYLIASLEQGMQYAIFYGDNTASFPEYDLSFSKYVSDSITTLTPEDIEKLPVSQSTETSSWMPFLKTYGVWMVILLIILQILYIVRRLLKSQNG